MCGLAGFLTPPGRWTQHEQRLVLDRMLRVLRHRGPDEEGSYLEDGVALGIRRLKIQDLVTGSQPLRNEDGSVQLVLNGEIYNAPALRSELEQRGHRFATHSDAEVLSHGYEEEGTGWLDRVRGMFAFALWDHKRQKLWLGRDRFGMKPLYYAELGQTVVFASELKAILQFPGIERQLDLAALDAYLTLEFVPSPRTILSGISKLPPASWLEFQGGQRTIRQYWNWPEAREPGQGPSYPEAVHEIRARLEQAVRCHLKSDVPVGIFLSGGVDSSGLLALARRSTGASLPAFSVGFDEQSFDETRYARHMAAAAGVSHTVYTYTARDFLAQFDEVVGTLDEPFGDPSVFPTAYLAKQAKASITVALSGDGGDELFFGYPTYTAHQAAEVYQRLPNWFRTRLVEPLIQKLPVSRERLSWDYRLKRFIASAGDPVEERHLTWMGAWPPSFKKTLYRDEVGAEVPTEPLWGTNGFGAVRAPNRSLLRRAQEIDLRYYLADDLLVKMDRAGMRYALEARIPYLDQELAEYALSLPSSYHVGPITLKRLLRDALAQELPPSIRSRRKQGFGLPISAWIPGPLRPLVEDTLSRSRLVSRGLFNPRTVERVLKEHVTGRVDRRKELWVLLMFEWWAQRYLD